MIWLVNVYHNYNGRLPENLGTLFEISKAPFWQTIKVIKSSLSFIKGIYTWNWPIDYSILSRYYLNKFKF